MRTGLAACVLFAVTAQLVLARSTDRGRTPMGRVARDTNGYITAPPWFYYWFPDFMAPTIDCAEVQNKLSDQAAFNQKYRLPNSCTYFFIPYFCDSIVMSMTDTNNCKIREVAIYLNTVCGCSGSTPTPVPGNWGPWTESVFYPCPVTCGTGIERYTRSRQCNNPAPVGEGQQCPGDGNEGPFTRSCTKQDCDVAVGTWSAWTEIVVSSCSVTCGEGLWLVRKTRQCNGGDQCPGNNVDSVEEPCNEAVCPVDGGYGDWILGTPEACSASCEGGTQTRTDTRVCDSPAPSNGGKDCVGSTTRTETLVCNDVPCPGDGNWGAWVEVATSSCTLTCGGGTMNYKRTRSCDNPAPTFGGRDCQGNSEENIIKSCNEDPCIVHGVWGEWTTGMLGPCSVSCGGGTQSRTKTRLCNMPSPAFGGNTCPGSNTETETFTCNTLTCQVNPPPINGMWSEWFDTTLMECSTQCGGGRQDVNRTRTCTNPPPANGGLDCVGDAVAGTFEVACNEEDINICPQPACQMNRIIGGNEVSPPCKYPFVVGVRRFNSYSCGATLVGLNKVITAAHCVDGLSPEMLSVEVGKHCKSTTGSESYNSNNPNMEVLGVIGVVVHENYNYASGLFSDIAVLKLEKDVVLTSCRQIISMAPSTQVTQTGRTCTVLGWGVTTYRGSAAPVLQEVDLELYDSEDCKTTFPGRSSSVDDNVICASNGVLGGEDACQGDSGGPLVCFDNNQWVQYGIVSSGFQCALAGEPGLYMEIAAFRDWVDNQFV